MASIKLVELESIDSTNDYLKENHHLLPSFTIVRTEYQTKGRGQFERVWQANKGENLLMSLLLKDLSFDVLTKISSWVVQSLLRLLKDYGINARFKEPNDIYVDDEKICGILIETKSTEQHIDYVIVGIGLNVNQTVFGDLNATSLKKQSNKTYAVRKVLRHLTGYLLTSMTET